MRGVCRRRVGIAIANIEQECLDWANVLEFRLGAGEGSGIQVYQGQLGAARPKLRAMPNPMLLQPPG